MPAIRSGKDDYQTYTNNNFLNMTPIVWEVIARINKSMPAIHSGKDEYQTYTNNS